ncbi:HAMP domain-containing histidine kinase [Candidatus Woesearchaeota archaeon]|nr:HAMP domain-containing histidine kinase [Candidatus Woesearchaeota archaeon]
MHTDDETERQNHIQMLDEVVFHLQHDVNVADTMIQGSQGVIDMLLRNPERDPDGSKKAWYQESIRRARSHKSDLLNILLTVRTDGYPPYNPEPIGLLRAVQEAVTTCAGMLEMEHIKLDVDYTRETADSMRFMGEPVRMRTVMMNLFSNMRRALAKTEAPEIRLGVYDLRQYDPASDMGRVVMGNNGPRLPFDDLEDAFRPYISGSGSKGVGLTICRDIIQERFGGRIYAEHPPEGGVTFYIDLPLCK